MRIVVADDHALFRAGFRLVLIQLLGDATDVLETSDFPQTLDLIQQTDELDLIFCDLYMPGLEPLVGLREVIRHARGIPVIVLSASEQAQDVRECIRAGARAYLFKHEDLTVLRHVTELAMVGRVYAPVEALGDDQDLPLHELRLNSGPLVNQLVTAGLSERQRVIVSLLGKGLSNKEIARSLSIAEGTVKSQLRAAYRRLGVRNRTEAALLLNRSRLNREKD